MPLLHRAVADAEVYGDAPGNAAPALVATYVGADGAEVLSMADLAFVPGAGAALALIPPGQAQEWMSSGTLPDDAVDNAAEVLNVLAATLNDVNPSRHVTMTATRTATTAAPIAFGSDPR